MAALRGTAAGRHATYGMLKLDYWSAVTIFLFGVGFQPLVSTRCSPVTSCYVPSSNIITSKHYLIPRRSRE
jgi:hypothetical protein